VTSYNYCHLVITPVGWEGMDWIHLAQDSDKWRAFAKAGLTFKNRESYI